MTAIMKNSSNSSSNGEAQTVDSASPTSTRPAASRRASALEEDEFYPHTLQEELNEILEAFYEAISEEEIRAYQDMVESIMDRKIAQNAIAAPQKAPDFELEDQDGDMVSLSHLLKRGPVVLIFYRGKWCPHCNATIMRMQRYLERIQAAGATLVAISPMLPDGTQFLASKRCLKFPVCSDVGNEVARKFKITFEVLPEFRDAFTDWGEHVPDFNGDESWEIPLPATYVIDQKGEIIWSFVDNDPGCRAEPEDILMAIPVRTNKAVPADDDDGSTGTAPASSEELLYEINNNKRGRGSRGSSVSLNPSSSTKRKVSNTFRRSFKKLFGKKDQPAAEYLGHYMAK